MAESAEPRPPWTRERVLHAAIDLADERGIESLSMRKLGQALGVEPMSLYNHVANKERPARRHDRRRLQRDRDALRRGRLEDGHASPGDLDPRRSWRAIRWAIGLMESRTSPGPATLRHHDAVIGTLRDAGFSIELAAHAFSALDSYIYGFALQEACRSRRGGDPELAQAIMASSPSTSTRTSPSSPSSTSSSPATTRQRVRFGLDLILDGLERAHEAALSLAS